MYKVKLFAGRQQETLERTINEWLDANKDISIHATNITTGHSEHEKTGEYVFYILYTKAAAEAAAINEMAASVTQEQSIDVKDINPEILKASS